jgi:hypothetical protein
MRVWDADPAPKVSEGQRDYLNVCRFKRMAKSSHC